VAAELVTVASAIIAWGGGAGGGAGQAPLLDSQERQAAADDDNDEDVDDFGKAKSALMQPRCLTLCTICCEWCGLESCKDQPIVGGFDKCEELFKSTWRKHHVDQDECFSRLKKIIEGLKKKAAVGGYEMDEVVAILEEIFQKDCKKSVSKMVG
jgi:hypothetical protein